MLTCCIIIRWRLIRASETAALKVAVTILLAASGVVLDDCLHLSHPLIF
jgi:hypothetical protein